MKQLSDYERSRCFLPLAECSWSSHRIIGFELNSNLSKKKNLSTRIQKSECTIKGYLFFFMNSETHWYVSISSRYSTWVPGISGIQLDFTFTSDPLLNKKFTWVKCWITEVNSFSCTLRLLEPLKRN